MKWVFGSFCRKDDKMDRFCRLKGEDGGVFVGVFDMKGVGVEGLFGGVGGSG